METDILHAFIQVIDEGSLAKAAEKLYLSSTALMKQMNVLEAEIGVQLLVRTNHGISTTGAGESFYQDAKFLIQYAEQSIVRTRQIAQKETDGVRVGNSMLNPCQALLNLWNEAGSAYPQFKIRIVPLDDAAQWPMLYRTIGKDFDIIVGAYEHAYHAHAFQVIPLGEYRVCMAVSRAHALASKQRLALSDLYGERIAVLKPGISPLIDEIREHVTAKHPQIQIKAVLDYYDVDIFNRCEEHGAMLLTLESWKDVHPSLVTIPVDWEYTMPYGILYPLKPSSNVQRFVNALQGVVHSPNVGIDSSKRTGDVLLNSNTIVLHQ